MRQSLFERLNKKQQSGFSLLIVLAILIVISLIVVGGAQYVNTDLRISANDSDRKVTFTYAESTLKAAENKLLEMEADLAVPETTVQDLVDTKKLFTKDCKGSGVGGKWEVGLCTASSTYTPVDEAAKPIAADATNAIPAWERADVWTTNSIENTITGNVSSKQPRYIIEILDKDANGTRNYRITSRAWGKNTNTVVTLQSYVSVGE
jgi:type IV pilus assembly protein PilX